MAFEKLRFVSFEVRLPPGNCPELHEVLMCGVPKSLALGDLCQGVSD